MAQFQCPKCGKILEKGIPQCPTCGARFNWSNNPNFPKAPAVPQQAQQQDSNSAGIPMMSCKNHPNKNAMGTCTYCGKFFCADCLVDVKGRSYCREHVSVAFDEVEKQQVNSQPIVINNNSNATSSAAAAASAAAVSGGHGNGRVVSPKSKMLTLILAIFGGFFGIHQFYAGNIMSGLLYMFTCGLCGVMWIIDIIKILSGTFKDGNGLPITR